MKAIEKTVFVTDDGMEFLDAEKAKMHEINIKNIKHFLVHYAPDKTQTGNYTRSVPVAVHASPGCHKHVMYQYLMKCRNWNAITEGVMGHGYMRGFLVEEIDSGAFLSSKASDKIFLSQINVMNYPEKTDFIEEFAKPEFPTKKMLPKVNL